VHTTGVLEARCEFVAATGKWDEVAALEEEARAYAIASEALPPPIYAERLRGRATLAAGEPGRAAETLTSAAERFRRLGAPYDRAVTQADLARALIAGGRSEGTATILDEADRTFGQLKATKAQEMVRKVRGELEG
jgi:hypothetical protein